MITLDLSILNQKGTPMFNSDIFANRPAAGVVGRIFISTDTKVFYRDTGTTWELVGGSGSGTITGSGTAGTLPIWTSSSALGDSSLLEGSTKISTIKDIQADGYFLSGMILGTGALYFSTTPEDRVTLANYNVGGTVYIEVDGGTYAAKWGTDLSLTNYGYIAATPTLNAANNASSLASYGINTLSYAAGFSSNNIGALYGGMAGFNLQTFAGSATFAQANVASGSASINSIDFSSAGSTITMTQSSGIRVMSGSQSQLQYQGTNSGTITHAAISQNLGFYRPSGASGILTITNAYSHLINALDDYGAGFTFTNRWGIYQAGASDKNYFAANMLLGNVVDNGNRLQVNGNSNLDGLITASYSTNDYVSFSSLNTNNNASVATSNAIKLGITSTVGTHYGTFKITESSNNDNSADLTISLPYAGTESDKLKLTAIGDLLIGGSTQLYGAVGRGLVQISGTTQALLGFGTTANVGLGFLYHSGTNLELSNAQNGPLIFTTNSIERARFSNTGNFLLGSTADPGDKFFLNGSLRIDGQRSSTAGGNSGQHLLIVCDGIQYKINLLNP